VAMAGPGRAKGAPKTSSAAERPESSRGAAWGGYYFCVSQKLQPCGGDSRRRAGQRAARLKVQPRGGDASGQASLRAAQSRASWAGECVGHGVSFAGDVADVGGEFRYKG
jgi:hypothetical protein